MLRRKTKHSPQNAVAAGNTVVYQLPVDRRYFQINFQYKTNANRSTIESDITEVRVIVDDVVQRRATAAQILDIASIYGRAFQAGFLPIYFAEPWLANLANQNETAWSMGDVANFRIELDIDSGASSPTLAAFSVHDNPIITQGDSAGQLPPLGNIVKYVNRTVGVTSTGDKEILDLPKDLGSYKALHMFEGSANDINSATVEVDQLRIVDQMTNEQLFQILESRDNDLVPGGVDGDVLSVIFSDQGNLRDLLPMVKSNGQRVSELKVTTNMANATDYNLIAEVYGPAN